MRNKLAFVKKVVYKLKRSYGLPIDYYQITNSDLDKQTGERITVLTKTRIRKAVVLRAREFRSFVYDLAFISANKDFTTGGYFDPEDRKIIIDPKDVPVGFEPNVDDYFIYQNVKYEIKEVFHFEEDYAYTMTARKLRGTPIVRIEEALSVMNLQQESASIIQNRLERSVESVLTLTQTVEENP